MIKRFLLLAIVLPGLLLVLSLYADARKRNCPAGYYRSRSAVCVPRPTTKRIDAPFRPSAICRDGTQSYSLNRRGTCSHHGGVSRWLR